jgi:hypothetical protein
MSYTDEEKRALAYNLSLKSRRQAANARAIQLKGNDGALLGLIKRTQAISSEENNEQKSRIRYDERDDFANIIDESGSISGDAGNESEEQISRRQRLGARSGLSGLASRYDAE